MPPEDNTMKGETPLITDLEAKALLPRCGFLASSYTTKVIVCSYYCCDQSLGVRVVHSKSVSEETKCPGASADLVFLQLRTLEFDVLKLNREVARSSLAIIGHV